MSESASETPKTPNLPAVIQEGEVLRPAADNWLTRAMRTLFGKTRYSSPSRFLRDLPEDTFVKEGTGFAPQASSSYSGYGSQRNTSIAPRSSNPIGTRIVEREPDYSEMGEGIQVRPGSKVFHAQFGEGIVERVDGGNMPTVTAKFGKHGIRRIHAKFLEYDQ